jgi:hypothetical protein
VALLIILLAGCAARPARISSPETQTDPSTNTGSGGGVAGSARAGEPEYPPVSTHEVEAAKCVSDDLDCQLYVPVSYGPPVVLYSEARGDEFSEAIEYSKRVRRQRGRDNADWMAA